MCRGATREEKIAKGPVSKHERGKGKNKEVYSFSEPEADLRMSEHFSSLLFGGSVSNTVLEFALLLAPFIALGIYGVDSPILNVEGSMSLLHLSVFFVIASLVRRFYNTYLEAVYFTFPNLRIQPPKDHLLKQHKDLNGRDREQLRILHWHDKMTMISQFALNFGLYYALPGFYPGSAQEGKVNTFLERFLSLLLNHYVMSFGMYWAHRSLHVVPFLWDKIHSIHHWAKHPLSRNTYEDHWFDNFFNAIIGHMFAQILVPLDQPTFWFSRIFRILESLEKHSGVSCGFNLAHSSQQWLPFAQMPHHHDWHHEGFKGSNYTFSSIGGLWDCIFGTRKGGRYQANGAYAATREDKRNEKPLNVVPESFSPLLPIACLFVAVGLKLNDRF